MPCRDNLEPVAGDLVATSTEIDAAVVGQLATDVDAVAGVCRQRDKQHTGRYENCCCIISHEASVQVSVVAHRLICFAGDATDDTDFAEKEPECLARRRKAAGLSESSR